MRAEKVVKALLAASSDVQAIATGGVHPCVAPLGTAAPYVVFALEGAKREPTISMDSIAIVVATVSVMAIAADYETMKTLLEACRVAVAYQAGAINGVNVSEILILDEGADQYQPDVRLYGQAMAFSITHQE